MPMADEIDNTNASEDHANKSGLTEGESDDKDLLDEIHEFVSRSKQHWGDWRKDAREDYAFVSGDQWTEEDREVLKNAERPVITFNRISPVIDTVSGSEVSNRQEVRFIPRQVGATGVNEVLTATAEWARDTCDAEDEESDAFQDAITCGLGCTETHMSYDDNQDGEVDIDRVDPLEMYPDPDAVKRNLVDSRKLARVREVDVEYIEHLWPDKADEIGSNDPWGDLDRESDDDTQIHHRIAGDQYQSGRSPEQATGKNKRILIEYQWFEYESFHRVLDPSTGQITELDSDKFENLSDNFERKGVQLQAVKQKRKRFMRAFVCGDTILEKGEIAPPLNPDAKERVPGFTYKFITGKRDRNKGTWYGLVRSMKDPQRWANKWLSQTLHIINTNAKGGVMIEKDAVDNVRKFEDSWAKSDAITWLKPGGAQKIEPKPAITFPAGMDKLMEFAVSSIRDVSGVNLELLGLAEKDQAGVLEYQRKQAGLTVLATLFDSLRRYRKEQGRLLLYFINNYIPDGTLVKIVGPDGEQYIPFMRQPDTVKYDVIVDEAPSSPNQKERVWQLLQPLMPTMMKMGMPPSIWAEVIKFSPLPESLVNKVVQAISNPPPNPQAQQQQMEQQAATMKAQGEQAKAQAQVVKAQAEVVKAKTDAESAQFDAMSKQGNPLEQSKTLAEIENLRAAAIASLAKAGATQLGPQLDALELILTHLAGSQEQEQPNQ